jgi:predicted N-acetyltransferase YhbS
MDERAGLTFRSNYFGDAPAFRALGALLEDTFDIDISLLDKLGGPDPTSTAFAWFDGDGACIANITAFSLPLVIDGRFVRAAGLQSGAVRPAYRGQGLFRDVLEAALDHCDREGFEAIALLTDKPDLYAKHGFRTFAQHRFAGPPPQRGEAYPGARSCRSLDLTTEADITLLRRLLDGRRPVSDRFAPLRQMEMFLFNASMTPGLRLDIDEEDNAVIAWRTGEDGSFELLDIVGARIPTLAGILARLQITPARVVVHFAPDHLDWEGEARPATEEVVLMLRGADHASPAEPFALSPLAEF